MIPIQEKISNHFASIPHTEIKNRELIMGMPYYLQYKDKIAKQNSVNKNEMYDAKTKKFLLNNPSIVKKYISTLYFHSIYFKSEQIINFIKELGYETINFNHFIDIEEFEEVMFGIIKEGVMVNFFQFLILLEISYKQRIYNTLFQDCINGKILPKYDKRKNVPEVAVNFKNIIRKVKDNPTKIRLKDDFEKLMTELLNKSEYSAPKTEFNLAKSIVDVVNLRVNNSEFKRLLLKMLKPHIEMHGEIKTKEIFQPYFYMLFENDKRSGLLKEVDFYQEYKTKLGDVTSYNGNYKNYYNSRIKALVGI